MIIVVGALGPRMSLKSHSVGGMSWATSLRRKVAWREEEISQKDFEAFQMGGEI